jgi:hypothetical protein
LNISALTYGFDRKADVNSEETEMEFLRNAAGYALKPQIRNTVLRKKINIFSLKNGIQNNRLNWISHVGSMEPERIRKQLLDYVP